jgi:cation:H+ antiporter
VKVGLELGIDEFVLVQWVAPLASEAPEIAVAVMFAVRGMGALAMGILISSKVNQWTLLVGTLPLVYSVSAGSVSELPLDTRQADEFLLTAAQSLFAVLLLAAMRVSWRGGLTLLVLFLSQLFFTDTFVRMIFSMIYIGLSLGILMWDRERREGTKTLLAGAVRWMAPAR